MYALKWIPSQFIKHHLFYLWISGIVSEHLFYPTEKPF